jgi:hypothetical protein
MDGSNLHSWAFGVWTRCLVQQASCETKQDSFQQRTQCEVPNDFDTLNLS